MLFERADAELNGQLQSAVEELSESRSAVATEVLDSMSDAGSEIEETSEVNTLPKLRSIDWSKLSGETLIGFALAVISLLLFWIVVQMQPLSS